MVSRRISQLFWAVASKRSRYRKCHLSGLPTSQVWKDMLKRHPRVVGRTVLAHIPEAPFSGPNAPARDILDPVRWSIPPLFDWSTTLA